jgi:hypothetical protein
MGRLLAILGSATVLAACLAGAVASARPAAGCAGTPRLSIVSRNPVVVAGSGFCAHQRVRVRAAVGGAGRTHRLRTGAHGGLRTRFAALAAGACSGQVRATARDASGRLLASTLQPRRDCAPR